MSVSVAEFHRWHRPASLPHSFALRRRRFSGRIPVTITYPLAAPAEKAAEATEAPVEEPAAELASEPAVEAASGEPTSSEGEADEPTVAAFDEDTAEADVDADGNAAGE